MIKLFIYIIYKLYIIIYILNIYLYISLYLWIGLGWNILGSHFIIPSQ